jgi:TPR repeat protein
VSLGIASATYANFDTGLAAKKRGDYATAVAAWRLMGEQGHRKAQYELALLFSFGKGVPVDFEQAVRWLQRSADQGYPPAQFRLGQHYYGGVGVDRNRDQGIFWVGVASSLGFEEANRWANDVELNLTAEEELKLIKRVGAWRPRPESQVSAAPPDIVPAVRVGFDQG